MTWSFRPPPDPVSAAYRAATPRRLPRRAALADLRCVVVDAETSGFNIEDDRMLSLAAVEVRDGRIAVAEMRSWFVFQPHARANVAVAVHGILPVETAAGVPEEQVLAELLPRLEGAVLVGHHVRFDARVIDAALRRHRRTGLRNPLLDTARLAMEVIDAFHKSGYAAQHPPTLDEVCAHCDLPPVGRHTAEGDAFTAAEILLLLAARLRKRLGRPVRVADLPLERL